MPAAAIRQDARNNGWLQAQRKAWEKLGGPKISDSDLEDMVSAVVIESEQIGPRRYIAKLGVVFDRPRAGALIGRNDGPSIHSAPMLTIPVLRFGRNLHSLRDAEHVAARLGGISGRARARSIMSARPVPEAIRCWSITASSAAAAASGGATCSTHSARPMC